MTWKQLLAVAVLGGSSAVAAIAAPASPAAQATRPAGAAPRTQQVAEDRRPRVLVLPFTELSDEPKREWVGKAMQQSLIAELTRSGLVSVATPPADAAPAPDAAAAAKLARDVHAPLAIMGSYQLVGEELRVTGQMIEAIDGEHIAAIKATGSLRDLFSIEDMIGSQVRRDLQVILQPPPAPSDPNEPGMAGANDPFGVQPTGAVQQEPPRGAYDGSDLQQSLESDRWSPPAGPSYANDRRNRVRYDYPPYYYPPYSYYDWCGYNYYPIIIRPGGGTVVPPGPGPTRTDFPQNNYNTVPGQMGRARGNTNYNDHPGQMGRSNGNPNFNTTPGQMNRGGGGNSNFNNPPGQSGRSSGGGNQVGSVGRSSGASSGSGGAGGAGGSRSFPGSSGNASGNLGSTSGNASKR